MWVVHLALGFAALYAAIIAAMYFAQTWLIFPTALAGVGQVQLPASSHLLEIKTPDGETLVGVRIPSADSKGEAAATLLGFAGNAMCGQYGADATLPRRVDELTDLVDKLKAVLTI